MSAENEILAMTVNEAVTRYPATVAIFSRYGIDSCCGGALPVIEAASRHNVDRRVLETELLQAIG